MSEYDDQQPVFDPHSLGGTDFGEQPTEVQPTRIQSPQLGYNAPVYGNPAPAPGSFGGANGPVNPSQTPLTSPKKGVGGSLKSLLVGLLGGVVGSLVVAAVMHFAGASGVTSSGNATSDPTTSIVSVDGGSQTITIENDGTATVAEAVAAKCLPSVVSVYVTSSEGYGMGSGVILDIDGNIITNAHVVEGAEEISVTIGGATYEAELVGADDSSDIAVVKADLNGASVTPIEVGDSDELVVGDWVMTIGSPYGLEQSASAGIVSALSRSTTMTSTTGTRIYGNLIQVDANINSGNSGGALVNDRGQLVGINTLFESTSGAFSGIGFSISGNYAVSIANKIIAGETVTHAYIGLSMLTVTEQNSQGLAVSEGAYVAEIPDDSPAGEAGIEAGDVVVRIDDTKITSASDVVVAVRGYEEGDVVTVLVNRDGEELSFEVTLGNDEVLQAQQQQEQSQQDQHYDNPLDEFYEQYDYPQDSPFGGEDEFYEFLEELFGERH